jgi:hypothetical protein
VLSTRLVQPTHRWRLRGRDLLIGLGSLLALVGLFTAGYFLTANRYEWVINPQAGRDQAVIQAMPVPGSSGPIVEKQVFAQPPKLAPTATAVPTSTPVGSSVKTTPSSGEQAIDEEAQAEIYTTIARQLFTVDNTFGGKQPDWQVLYLITVTNDEVGDPNVPKKPAITLPEPVQSAVMNKLTTGFDQKVNVIWIEKREQAKIEPKNGLVVNGRGAIITFGNIQPQKDGTVHVSASLFFSSVGATGKTYILTKVDGVWQITGTTGVERIS